MTLIEQLHQVPEFRAARGQRHELWFVLLPIILGSMLGIQARLGLTRDRTP